LGKANSALPLPPGSGLPYHSKKEMGVEPKPPYPILKIAILAIRA
jgi:hypothetical protein